MIEFFQHLNSLHPLLPEATAALMKVIKPKELRKGQVWQQEGAVCDKMNFVIRGLLKLYFETGAKEVIMNFARENEWMVSAQSFISQQPSSFTMRTAEPTVIVYVNYHDLQHLLDRYMDLNIHFRHIAQQQITALEDHMRLLMLPPRERFEKLTKEQSWMVNGSRLTDRLLAAYLGVGANAVCGWRR